MYQLTRGGSMHRPRHKCSVLLRWKCVPKNKYKKITVMGRPMHVWNYQCKFGNCDDKHNECMGLSLVKIRPLAVANAQKRSAMSSSTLRLSAWSAPSNLGYSWRWSLRNHFICLPPVENNKQWWHISHCRLLLQLNEARNSVWWIWRVISTNSCCTETQLWLHRHRLWPILSITCCVTSHPYCDAPWSRWRSENILHWTQDRSSLFSQG